MAPIGVAAVNIDTTTINTGREILLKIIIGSLLLITICMVYPNVLLNNTHPLPLKSIHDVVEKFNCKSDLNQCGEFYIDETVMVRYSVQSQSHRKK